MVNTPVKIFRISHKGRIYPHELICTKKYELKTVVILVCYNKETDDIMQNEGNILNIGVRCILNEEDVVERLSIKGF